MSRRAVSAALDQKLGHERTRAAMRGEYPRFSDREYARRYKLTHGLMDDAGLDCLLLYGDSTLSSLHQLNCHWLSNYLDEQYSYVVVPRHGDPTLYVSIPADVAAAMAISPIDDAQPGGVGVAMATTLCADLAQRKAEIKRLGLVDNTALAPGLPHAHHQLLTEALPGVELVRCAREYERLKAIPSSEELEWIKRGVALTDLAWERLIDAIEPGRSEADLLAVVHSAYLQAGGCYCFAILGSTPMAEPAMAYPHGIPGQPSQRRLLPGDFVLCELSASYYGYAGQCFCAVSLGEPSDEVERMAG